jgi:hypothetical protein
VLMGGTGDVLLVVREAERESCPSTALLFFDRGNCQAAGCR